MLTLAEYDERAAVLWRTRTRGELEALVVDLPPPAPPARAVATARTAPRRVIAGVHARALMGEVEVQVPPGAQVLMSGMALMGERRMRVAPGDGPVVHVDAYALMGSVSVTVGDGRVVPAASGLPAQRHVGAPALPPRTRPLARLGQSVGAGILPLALLGGAGAVVASGTDARAVFGSSVERVREGDSKVNVSTLFGSVEIVTQAEYDARG